MGAFPRIMSMVAKDGTEQRELDSQSKETPRRSRPISLGQRQPKRHQRGANSSDIHRLVFSSVVLFGFLTASWQPVEARRVTPFYPYKRSGGLGGGPGGSLLDSTSADISQSLEADLPGAQELGFNEPEIRFVEELQESCRTNPISCDVLSALYEATIDDMMTRTEERLLSDVANDVADVNNELLLSRAVRSPEGDLNRLVAQSRDYKQRLRNARRRSKYGLKFNKMG